MTDFMGNAIADSLQLSLGYAERLLTGITPEVFARFARPGGVVVESNHAAFVLGHLCLYPGRILPQLGREQPSTDARFAEVFSKDATCRDDPEGAIYPAMNEVTSVFHDGYRQALEAIRATDDTTFQQPNPTGGRLTELFPTLGSVQNFYVGGHMMMHLGQLSAWRRMMGLSPA